MSEIPPPGATPARGGKLAHTTLIGFFWMFLGTGAQSLLQLLVILVLARILTPRDFGIVSAALVVVGFSAIFSKLGVGPAIVQRPTLTTAHLRTGFTLAILSGMIMAGIIFLGSGIIANFFHIPELLPIVQVLSLNFLFEGISVMPESLLQRELLFRKLAAIEVVAFLVGFGALGITLAYLGFGVWALALAYQGQVLVRSALLLVLRPHPMKPLMDRGALNDFVYFGGGFTAARIGNYIGGQGDKMVVGRWLGAELLGVYGRAYQLMVTPATTFGTVLDKVLFPAMAQVQGRADRLTTAYRRGVALVALVTIPAGVACYLLAPELVEILLGKQWGAVVAPFQIFALGLVFRTSYKLSDSISRATGAVYRRAWRQWVYAFLVTGGAYVGSFWGVEGASLCVLGAIAANFLLMAHLSLDLAAMRWRTFLLAHVPAMILAAVLGVEAWFIVERLRAWFLEPVEVLIGVTLPLFLTSFLLLRYLPGLVLGKDGLWMVRTMVSYLPRRIRTLRWLTGESGR